MCLKQNDQFATHILKDYLCKLHIDSSIINGHKHISTAIDKGVHPSLGLHLLVQLSMDLLFYLLKVIKSVLYSAQNAKYMAPMAPECRKTPTWDFSAPGLAKK